MIPQFPKFKKVNFDDRTAVEKITSHFLPYSDFNFTSLYIWNLSEQNELSVLNGNLIISLRESAGARIVSIIGDTRIDESISTIFLNLENQSLGLVPEVAVKCIKNDAIKSIEEKNHHDYVYDLEDINHYQGRHYRTKRKLFNRFINRNSPSVSVMEFNKPNRDRILDLFDRWASQKIDESSIFHRNERMALERFFEIDNIDASNFVILGVEVSSLLVGFSIAEKLKNHYTLLHFEKGMTSEFPGIGAYLFNVMSKNLLNAGYRYINLEEDLGLDGLRTNKMSYRPVLYLKKYGIIGYADGNK